MAVKFVYHLTGDDVSNNGDAAGTPYATISKAASAINGGAPAPGDIIYVDYRHTESINTEIDFLPLATNWSSGGELYLVSSDFDTGGGTNYLRQTTGLITISGTSNGFKCTTATGAAAKLFTLHVKGLRIHANAGSLKLGGAAGNPLQARFTDCYLQKTYQYGMFYLLGVARHELKDCDINYTSSYQAFWGAVGNGPTIEVVVDNCTMTGTAPVQDSAFFEIGAGDNPSRFTSCIIKNSDISHLTRISNFSNSGRAKAELIIENCKYNASLVEWAKAVNFTTGNLLLNVTESSTSDITATPLPVTRIENVSGVITSDTATYYTSTPANDGEQDYSLKLASGTGGNKAYPLETPPMSIWHPGGNASLTIRCLCDSASGGLKDDEIWVEGDAPGHTADTGSATVGRRIDTRPAFGAGALVDTSTYWKTDTDASWTTGEASPLERKFVVPVNATEPGAVNVQVKLGIASKNVYVSPNIELA